MKQLLAATLLLCLLAACQGGQQQQSAQEQPKQQANADTLKMAIMAHCVQLLGDSAHADSVHIDAIAHTSERLMVTQHIATLDKTKKTLEEKAAVFAPAYEAAEARKKAGKGLPVDDYLMEEDGPKMKAYRERLAMVAPLLDSLQKALPATGTDTMAYSVVQITMYYKARGMALMQHTHVVVDKNGVVR